MLKYDRDWLTLLWAALEGRRDQRSFTPTITVPTVVVHSRDDAAITFTKAEELTSRIPSATLIEVDKSGHALPIENPKEITKAIRLVIEEINAKRRQDFSGRISPQARLQLLQVK